MDAYANVRNNREKLVDSHAVVKNNAERSWALNPVFFIGNTLQYHNQDIDINEVKIQTIFTTRIPHVALLQPHLLPSGLQPFLKSW